ncbi:HIF-1 transcription factor component sima isoform X2 [Choristoneura fumiferana]|uniref:HIF-1 transcription factor component sima isoform X2 n=1 Tax=Choristoneura fumiferana TaxID=7141 RepID=UPI003D15DEB8
MVINGFKNHCPQQCPVVGRIEDIGWTLQCPVTGQWSRQPVNNVGNLGASASNVFREVPQPMQCYSRNYYVPENPPQYFPSQIVYPRPVSHYQAAPIIPNLPCNQRQEWDYGNMCYNVNGQPCQYTNVVDLEDFMNNEKRKEKSRVAARCRRTKEMQIFSELMDQLPAKKEEVEQLDKASVMRLAISYLRARDVVSLLPDVTKDQPKIENPKGVEQVTSELSYMKALDGFVLVLSQQGDIVYCSENIADHLGVSQMEIMGQSVFEFSHPCDHDEIREALRSNGDGRRDLLLRLKCTLTSKGRNVHLKSASFKVIHVTGHMLAPSKTQTKTEKNNNDDKTNDVDKKSGKMPSLVAVGRPIPHPSNIEIPLDSKTFLTKHSLDMKFTYIDETLTSTLGFDKDELVGHSLYDYHHSADSASLNHQFKSLFSKGQCETGQYRFLAKTGGYAWVQTQATVITDKQQKPISIVCVNYIISGIEFKDEVFSTHQLQHADLKPKVTPAPVSVPVPVPVPITAPFEAAANGAIVSVVPSTNQIFAPRKKDMNKGYLMFSQDDEGLTMLKDEPNEEDLTHLAPTAGDTCIPLENSPFDMFDDFILSDNYCSLLGDDLANSPVDSLTADSLLLSSPEPHESDSSCEQSSLLTELSLDPLDSGRSDNSIDDGHSPFIPIADELPVLEPAVMWGALPDNVSMARPQPSEAQNASPAPALQRLLAAPPTGPPPQDLITSIYSDQGLIPSRSVPSWETGVKRVMKQEEEPKAKRVKRSPSPVAARPAGTAPSSSVLMNLLDLQQAAMQQMKPMVNQYKMLRNQDLPHAQTIPVPVINLMQSRNKPIPNSNLIPSGNIIPIRSSVSNPMSPLSLNVGSPMYSLPSSPNTCYSPAMSPAYRERVLSPYSTPQSMSPVGRYPQMYSPGSRLLSPMGVIHGSDPYLTNKLLSPSFPHQQADTMMDTSMPITSTDFWPESEMIQGSNDLLTAFDDVKLC